MKLLLTNAMAKRILFFFLTVGFFLHCQPELTLTAGDPQLQFSGGRWLFQEKPFTGKIKEPLPDAIRLTEYKDGAENGEQTMHARSGVLVEERFYKEGKKHGVHRGWFVNGQDRFYSEFNNDQYTGEQWTWHSNGKVAEFKKYTPDGQILVHKHWRESGQIYRNQVFAAKATTTAGMPGVKICNTVKDTVGSR